MYDRILLPTDGSEVAEAARRDGHVPALVGLLNPLLAPAAMAASSLLVVGNSSRRLLGDDDGNDVQREPAPGVLASPERSDWAMGGATPSGRQTARDPPDP